MSNYQQPDASGHFGPYGGIFVSETLMHALDELKIAYAGRQAAQVGALAHKLKSSALAVGALELGELCATIEQTGKAGQIEALASLLSHFKVKMTAVNNYLDTL